MNNDSKLSELMAGITKDDFETIRLTNKRPNSVPFDKYKALITLLNKMNKPNNFKPKKYHK